MRCNRFARRAVFRGAIGVASLGTGHDRFGTATKFARPFKGEAMSKRRHKKFASVFQNSVLISRHPGPHEGRFAIVTNVGLEMRWTR